MTSNSKEKTRPKQRESDDSFEALASRLVAGESNARFEIKLEKIAGTTSTKKLPTKGKKHDP